MACSPEVIGLRAPPSLRDCERCALVLPVSFQISPALASSGFASRLALARSSFLFPRPRHLCSEFPSLPGGVFPSAPHRVSVASWADFKLSKIKTGHRIARRTLVDGSESRLVHQDKFPDKFGGPPSAVLHATHVSGLGSAWGALFAAHRTPVPHLCRGRMSRRRLDIVHRCRKQNAEGGCY